MEIKDGRIMPTSIREAHVCSRMLKEQAVACELDPDSATVPMVGVELSGGDSHRLVCAVERAMKAPQSRSKTATKEEVKVFRKVIDGLARLSIEAAEREVEEFPHDLAGMADSPNVIRLAFNALTDRYD
jgi:hypothetical protein